MKVEWWSEARRDWVLSRCNWTAEEIAEINGTVGWEMYREAE